MIEWLQLSNADRLISLQQANIKSGIAAKVIEKDWWVTLVLKAVFEGEYDAHLSFKGGTSLSKGWKLIERFSEDIDLAIDRQFLGFVDQLSKSAVKRLKRAACEFTSTILIDALEQKLKALGVPDGMVTITADPIRKDFPDTDPQTLRISYPSLLDKLEYIADSVKLEVSARSLNEPAVNRPILSLLGEYMPGFPGRAKALTYRLLNLSAPLWKRHFCFMRNFCGRSIRSFIYACRAIYPTWNG